MSYNIPNNAPNLPSLYSFTIVNTRSIAARARPSSAAAKLRGIMKKTIARKTVTRKTGVSSISL